MGLSTSFSAETIRQFHPFPVICPSLLGEGFLHLGIDILPKEEAGIFEKVYLKHPVFLIVI
jgi:hypothetical protein